MKLYLGNIVWRDECVAHAQAMRSLVRHLDHERIEFTDGTVVGDALVSRARSIIASAFLRSDADVLLTVDSDIWFRPQDAVKLCREAIDKRVIGGMYLTRSLETQPAAMLPDEPVVFDDSAAPVQVQYASTGFMAVHRGVFKALSETLPLCHKGWNDRGVDTAFWPFFMPFTIPSEGEGHIYLSEDWAFCERARDAEFGIWLDPSIRLGHVGTVMHTLEDLVRPPTIPARPLRLTRDAEGHLRTEVLEPSQIA